MPEHPHPLCASRLGELLRLVGDGSLVFLFAEAGLREDRREVQPEHQRNNHDERETLGQPKCVCRRDVLLCSRAPELRDVDLQQRLHRRDERPGEGEGHEHPQGGRQDGRGLLSWRLRIVRVVKLAPDLAEPRPRSAAHRDVQHLVDDPEESEGQPHDEASLGHPRQRGTVLEVAADVHQENLQSRKGCGHGDGPLRSNRRPAARAHPRADDEQHDVQHEEDREHNPEILQLSVRDFAGHGQDLTRHRDVHDEDEQGAEVDGCHLVLCVLHDLLPIHALHLRRRGLRVEHRARAVAPVGRHRRRLLRSPGLLRRTVVPLVASADRSPTEQGEDQPSNDERKHGCDHQLHPGVRCEASELGREAGQGADEHVVKGDQAEDGNEVRHEEVDHREEGVAGLQLPTEEVQRHEAQHEDPEANEHIDHVHADHLTSEHAGQGHPVQGQQQHLPDQQGGGAGERRADQPIALAPHVFVEAVKASADHRRREDSAEEHDRHSLLHELLVRGGHGRDRDLGVHDPVVRVVGQPRPCGVGEGDIPP
mmetsp:Transcript_40506/g.116444  ORF Transcript_40506/g.116444 Transcript_40506/m.116444 type:complete len:537 (-) Transcript_40506:369-1979(-)